MFRRALALLLVSVPLFAAHGAHAQVSSPDARRPNVVLINADDLSSGDYARLGALRQATGAKGLTFRNGYVTTALCCPSRVSTLTGRYVHNHGVERHVGPDTGEDKFRRIGGDRSTVATWLGAAGYETALVGKYLNNYHVEEEKPPGWDHWFAGDSPAQSWRLNENGEVKEYSQDRRNPGYRHWEDMLGDKAVGVVGGMGNNPLFLYYAPHAPHTPELSPPRHDGRFAAASLPRGGAFDEADVSDKPGWVRGLPRVTDKQRAAWTDKHRARLRATLSIVDQIRRIEDALAKKGELADTVFILTSDNGYHMGAHRLPQGKQTPYETDHRVPLAIWGEGVETGIRGHYVLNTDLAPTIADLAGADVPDYDTRVDGRSFARLLTADPPAADYRRNFLVEGFHGADVKAAVVPPTYRTLYGGTQGFVYTRYETGEMEYYDLRQDPAQERSLHRSLSPSRRAALNATWSALASCEGDECRRAEGGKP